MSFFGTDFSNMHQLLSFQYFTFITGHTNAKVYLEKPMFKVKLWIFNFNCDRSLCFRLTSLHRKRLATIPIPSSGACY